MSASHIIRKGNIPALTGLRGVAAIWVVAYHFNNQIPVIEHGYLGVDIFFMARRCLVWVETAQSDLDPVFLCSAERRFFVPA